MHEGDQDTERLKDEITDIIKKCVRCRFCFTQCPVFETSYGWITEGSSGITQSLYYGIRYGKLDQGLRDILMRCTTCRSCEIICEHMMAGVKLVEAIQKGRQLLLELGINPVREHQKVLESIQAVRNPYGKPKPARVKWSEGLDIPFAQPATDIDTIYYTGCTTAYDERLQKVAQSLATILKTAGISFSIMKDEKCCGDPAYLMGEKGLFDLIVKENIQSFMSVTPQRVITTCPHGFHTFTRNYPERFSKSIQFEHHTLTINNLLKDNKLTFKKEAAKPIRVTYHDPCYLGKHQGIYEEPREILRSIPGVELTEMSRNRDKSLCCGGGGGRIWADVVEEKRLADVRIADALETGAEILVTACPFCLENLEAATKTLDVEKRLRIMDIAELVDNHLLF